ncbi:MAG: zf-HC2 domain-containing protein [Deltaproteobacteria bacterium]|nr:zf-HC2 domain-containing protein [Deltaproteobacteria bacterium]
MTKSNCREVLRCIDTFVDGELEPSEMLAMQEHVEGCEECSERVRFQRSMRASVRNVVQSARVSDLMRARVAHALAEQRVLAVRESEPVEAPAQVTSEPPRMLSWRVVGPLAAAAVLSLVLGSLANKTQVPQASSSPVGSASLMTLDAFLEEVVDQHAHPLPPETTNPSEVARFDQFVGVPVRPLTFNRFQGTLLGARMVPIRQSRAAMLQYVLTNGHRVSVYVYNPRAVRMVASPRMQERKNDNGPMYVGLMHGYSVAVTDRRGIGYALASDLDEQEILAVDLPQ